MNDRKIDPATGSEIKEHEWDGIHELDTPMPRWWLWTFYATIIFAIGYVIAYPAIPLATRATQGMLGWTSRSSLKVEQQQADAARADILKALKDTEIETLDPKSPLMQAAIEGGRAAFKVNCVQCHGSGAAGTKGYPNLNDDDWLWGGDMAAIHKTLEVGIRDPGNANTRISAMPAFGRDGILQPAEVEDVVSYVLTLSKQQKVDPAARRGAKVYADNCAVCHGPTGTGDRQLGAPNLTDPIWLYGGDRESIRQTVHNSRNGVMPAWGERLDPETVKMLTAYVHALGGGE
ncbi:MAG: cytochrome-c oxidase, cbb3-type subunit III [Alphaproteobacteria bacterium HGW-Alphaproteobacteria-16]|nr:MAG: cytochrome-c oxidase, cbb3-type subunit III [Alphaproteobacteria bacterium HGW-Alphaproteobacteria-16]